MSECSLVSDLEEFIQHLATERGLSDNYQLSTRRSLDSIIGWLEKRGITTAALVTLGDVQQYLAFRKDTGLAAASLKLEVVAAKIFFRWLTTEKRILRDPLEVLPLPKLSKHLPETLDKMQIEKLLQSPDVNAPLGYRDKAMLELLYASGLRASELVGTRLEHLDLDTGLIRITGKGGKTRLVPVGSAAREAIATYLQRERPTLVNAKTGSHVFLGRHGRPLTRERLLQIVKANARRAGIKSTTYTHLLRHSFATHLLGGGADLRIIQELLGHADISTTQIYTHVEQSSLKDMHRKLHPRG